MFTESFQVDITIKIAQHAAWGLVQTKLRTKKYEADPKINNGTWEIYPCQVNIYGWKTKQQTGKTIQLGSKGTGNQNLITKSKN